MPLPTLDIAIVPVTGFQQNCSILVERASKRAVVVDPGGDVPLILSAAKKLGVTPEAIWITHGHIDHAGGVVELKAALGGVPVSGPDERDKFLIDGLAQKGLEFGVTGAKPFTPERWLTEGDELKLGAETFKVLHVPGHSPGSVAFYNAANKFVFAGDALFRGSVGRTDFPYGDFKLLAKSIRTKLFPLGDDVIFLPGHGPDGRIGDERKGNPFVGEGVG